MGNLEEEQFWFVFILFSGGWKNMECIIGYEAAVEYAYDHIFGDGTNDFPIKIKLYCPATGEESVAQVDIGLIWE